MNWHKRATGAIALVAALAVLPTGAGAQDPPPAADKASPLAEAPTEVVLTLQDALALAEAHNPGLRLAQYQLVNARSAMATAPANAEALSSAASLYAQAQFGVTLPENAISPQVALLQAQVEYEQAVVQYFQARQQVRLGALQAYVEWQRSRALVNAQQSGLERAMEQEKHVQAALDAGMVARFDLLQVQAQVTGQQAALSGAAAMERSTRSALEQVIGRPLAATVVPDGDLIRSEEVALEQNVEVLTRRALTNRPDLRESTLDLVFSRLQASLVAGNPAASLLQVQAAAGQYEMAAAKARTEVQQALWSATGTLGELKAREAAVAPSQEALRLAELRYEAGLATYLEVQSALAASLQAEAARIQAAANLTLSLAKLAQATGEL
ncbi:MAG TPA: TolC family protein [Symbiobacteriaceae bacterium]|nr:TolC family protein [Symbiobacteriaceae bacterium]